MNITIKEDKMKIIQNEWIENLLTKFRMEDCKGQIKARFNLQQSEVKNVPYRE